MADRATFLHITDAHVSALGVPFERGDHKVDVPQIPVGTREQVLELLFRRLAERLKGEARTLDGVLFSGDVQIPISFGQGFRDEAGRDSDQSPATVPR